MSWETRRSRSSDPRKVYFEDLTFPLKVAVVMGIAQAVFLAGWLIFGVVILLLLEALS